MLYSAWKLRHTSAIVMSAIGIVIGIIVACCNAATTLFAVAAGAGLIYTAITGYLSQKAMEA